MKIRLLMLVLVVAMLTPVVAMAGEDSSQEYRRWAPSVQAFNLYQSSKNPDGGMQSMQLGVQTTWLRVGRFRLLNPGVGLSMSSKPCQVPGMSGYECNKYAFVPHVSVAQMELLRFKSGTLMGGVGAGYDTHFRSTQLMYGLSWGLWNAK